MLTKSRHTNKGDIVATRIKKDRVGRWSWLRQTEVAAGRMYTYMNHVSLTFGWTGPP